LLIESKEKNNVFWIILNRPEKANAINAQMWRSIADKLDEGSKSPDSRVVALTGTGRFFSAGEDIVDLNGAATFMAAFDLFIGTLRPVFDRVLKCPKPVIAAVNGQAVGAGTEMVFACDMAVADAGASFSLAQGKRGIGPALALTLGMPILGRKRLSEAAMTGRRFSAEEAEEWGIINSIARGGLESAVETLADEIAQTPPALTRIMKEIMLTQMSMLEYESAFHHIAMYSQSQETRQGISNFISKADR
jgi:enoyl-CoA hydratase/carnithine racemase